VIAAAEESLTADQRNLISRHYANVQSTPVARNNEPEAGPSKGKGIDPRNWGAAGISPKELTFKVQSHALQAWAAEREAREAEQCARMAKAYLDKAVAFGNKLSPKELIEHVKKHGYKQVPVKPVEDSNCTTFDIKPGTNPKTTKKYCATVEDTSDDEAPALRVPSMPATVRAGKDTVRTSRLPTPMSETVAKQVAGTVGVSKRTKSRRVLKVVSITLLSQIAPGSYFG